MTISTFEIVTFALTVYALLIAVPPFLQHIYGSPRITLEFRTQPYQFCLECLIFNLPIDNSFLRWSRVSRVAADIYATFEVREAGSNKLICSAAPVRIEVEAGILATRV